MKILIILLLALFGDAFAKCEYHSSDEEVRCENVSSADLGENLNLRDEEVFQCSKLRLSGFNGEFDNKTIKMFFNALVIEIVESKFPKLTNGMFRGLPRLFMLHINGNTFKSIEPDTFKDLNRLAHIEFFHNKDFHMDINVLKNNKRITSLGLPASVVKTLNPKEMKKIWPEFTEVRVMKYEKDELEEEIEKLHAAHIFVEAVCCPDPSCSKRCNNDSTVLLHPKRYYP